MSKRNAHQTPKLRVALDLLLWDVLLAGAMWYAVFLPGAIGDSRDVGYNLSVLFGNEIGIALAPSVVVWVGMRAALGLYFVRYRLGWMGEPMQRQALALMATAGILAAQPIGGRPFSLPHLFLWAVILLVAAPVMRRHATPRP